MGLLASLVTLAAGGCGHPRAAGGDAAVTATAGCTAPRAFERTTAAGHPDTMALVSRQSGKNEIYLMHVSASGTGSNLIRLLPGDTYAEDYPNWSPNGRLLVFIRMLDGSAIYVVSDRGTGLRRLSPTPGFDVTPSWSPNGSQIVYTRLLQRPMPRHPAPMTDIDVMNANGTGNRVILADTRFSVEPRWSVRNKIVFMSLMDSGNLPGLQLYVMNLNGTGLHRLTYGANNAEPSWSPDGTQIAFGSDRQGGGLLNIFVMDADGRDVRQLTHFRSPDEAGVTNWSPGGRQIAFQCDVDGQKQSNPYAFTQVWTMSVNGTAERSTGIQCSDVGCDPRWQPEPVRRN